MGERPALQPRLRAIADLVPAGSRLADIGTDHGYIPIDLLLAGRITAAIATDIGELPLDHARRTAQRCGLTAGIDFRLGDGLMPVSPGEVDVIVIAGMGGDNIAAILSAAHWAREGPLLLLQPMSKAEVLRSFLPENGFAVEAECLVADKGKLYPILTVRGGKMPPATAAEAWGGFSLQDDPLWGLYLEDRLLRLRRAAAGLARARDSTAEARREELRCVIEALESKRKEWELACRK